MKGGFGIAIGTEIRERRRAAGMRQKELAARLGCTPSAVSLWESGEALPSTGLLPEIAGALGCSIGALFGEAQDAQR